MAQENSQPKIGDNRVAFVVGNCDLGIIQYLTSVGVEVFFINEQVHCYPGGYSDEEERAAYERRVKSAYPNDQARRAQLLKYVTIVALKNVNDNWQSFTIQKCQSLNQNSPLDQVILVYPDGMCDNKNEISKLLKQKVWPGGVTTGRVMFVSYLQLISTNDSSRRTAEAAKLRSKLETFLPLPAPYIPPTLASKPVVPPGPSHVNRGTLVYGAFFAIWTGVSTGAAARVGVVCPNNFVYLVIGIIAAAILATLLLRAYLNSNKQKSKWARESTLTPRQLTLAIVILGVGASGVAIAATSEIVMAPLSTLPTALWYGVGGTLMLLPLVAIAYALSKPASEENSLVNPLS